MANYQRIFLPNHSYFFTIVTHHREPILLDNIELLRESFRESKRFFEYKIDAIVILPDHLHIILTPKNVEEYPRIIKAIKYNFSKRYNVDTRIEQSFSRHKRASSPTLKNKLTVQNSKTSQTIESPYQPR